MKRTVFPSSVSFRLPEQTRKELRSIADLQNRHESDLVRQAVIKELAAIREQIDIISPNQFSVA